ncbi:LysR family transcriptional regulator [Limnohabitans sp. 2KL-27]|jgi:DNA-binding transcriptional LysR family regulator|uniref:LysR family transcriptional regulator n=1 Tax=Limnohabitans sp. 2KL-27 TaxID=1100705 RepID=UPI000B0DEB64|nr:LysR family transcriptional regulator [Limnohabitans sp. 2KL-27]
MELKWLDDYLALIETGSFSAAAEKRHVSQPAFSRRIQHLEEWLGVELIDRTHKPLRFTPLATQHESSFRGLVNQVYEFRSTLKSDANSSPGLVISAQHSLAAAHLPAFLQKLRTLHPEQRFRIRSENRDEGVALLLRGQADILLVYESNTSVTGIPAQLATPCALGDDVLVLVASPKLCMSKDFSRPDHPLPLLCFPPESFFGQTVRTHVLPELMQSRLVAVQYVSEFSLGLREMALIHQGAAWLPRSLIAQDLKRKTLQELPTIGREVPLTIMAYFANHGSQPLQQLFAKFSAAQAKV